MKVVKTFKESQSIPPQNISYSRGGSGIGTVNTPKDSQR